MSKDSEIELMSKDEQIAYLKKIINLLPGNIYWKDKNGKYLGCNSNVAKILKLASPDEIIGKTDRELLANNYAEKVSKIDAQILATNSEQTIEEEGYDSQGNPTIYLSRKSPMHDAQNNVIGLLGISIDITDRKCLEDELAKAKIAAELSSKVKTNLLYDIVSMLPGNIYWKDREGKYLGCNTNLLKMLNLNSLDDIIGKTDEQIISASQARMVRAIDERIMQANTQETIEEYDYDAIDGPIIYLSTKAPLKGPNGMAVGILGVSIDITDRKKIENELILAKEKAEAANLAKTEFIHNMSHDIRTPFSGILGFSRILYDSETNIERKEILSYVVESSQRLLNFLNEILEIVSLENIGIPCKLEAFNLQKTIDDAIKLLEVEAKYKNIDLNLMTQDSLPKCITSDKIRIHRILINLISNAVKFTKIGSVNVEIAIQPHASATVLMIQVSDTGIGIPSEQFTNIFERFTRLTSSYQGIYKGTGLGLYIVKQFIDDLNGKITVQSQLGKGTTFTCTIPIEIPHPAEPKT